MGAKYAGVEDLQVYMNNTGYTANFYLAGTAYSWIKNVESNYTDGDHARIFWGYRNEIRDSYFHDAYKHTPGSTDANIFIANKSSGNLVENNALRRLHVSIMLNWGASGNVIAYNYMDNNFDSNGYNTLFAGLSVHGAHPMFNLWEGNIAQKLDADFFWGSSSHNTAFRNWFKGATLVIPPLTGRAPEDLSGSFWAPYALVAVDLGAPTRYYNILGNIIGSDRQKSFTKWTPEVVYPESRIYYSANNFFGYSFGYGPLTDQGKNAGGTPLVRSTTIVHGDYDYVKNNFIWSPDISNHTLPSSLYLSSKPSWFGNLSWPAFGPSLSNSNSPVVGNIPAKHCYDAQQMPNCFSNTPGSQLEFKQPVLPAESGDTISPTVSITRPLNSQTWTTGRLAINAGANDNAGVAGVTFYINGEQLGTEKTTAPYAINWKATVGTHTITAKARDAKGNTTTSMPVNVTIIQKTRR